MAERYSRGIRKLFYRAKGFHELLAVTMDILDPFMIWEKNISFIEAGGGLYYSNYNFKFDGTYVAVMYENGTKVTSQNFYISEGESTSSFTFNTFKGPSVINT